MGYFKTFPEIVFITCIVISIHASIEVCYDSLRIRSEPVRCTHSIDCYDPDAECIYSILESHHICCKPRHEVIFPECPAGRKMLTVGYMPILCSLENSVENDLCPQEYACLPSVKGFNAYNGRPYNICCTI